MSLQTLSDDAVLNCDVCDIATDGESLVTAPGNREMVEDHVRALGNGNGILAGIARLTHADADVPDDGIVSVGEGPAVSICCNWAPH